MLQVGLTMQVGPTQEWMALFKNPFIAALEMIMARMTVRKFWHEDANKDHI